ncbi:MAG TPA: M67 family metallopeptidase [Candidatus Angelobacter sp.]|nr:M67 family metallopeptidase [Candidatus Angelobacter sp.]
MDVDGFESLLQFLATVLVIRQTDYEQIRKEAEQRYPCEGCGILVGSALEGGRVVSIAIACNNMRTDSPGNRYSIDPQQIIAAQKLARSRGEDILGFYHSHPDYPSRYSSTDLAEAHWFGCSYVITAVQKGRATMTESFLLQGTERKKSFEPEKIEVFG